MLSCGNGTRKHNNQRSCQPVLSWRSHQKPAAVTRTLAELSARNSRRKKTPCRCAGAAACPFAVINVPSSQVDTGSILHSAVAGGRGSRRRAPGLKRRASSQFARTNPGAGSIWSLKLLSASQHLFLNPNSWLLVGRAEGGERVVEGGNMKAPRLRGSKDTNDIE